MTEITKVAENSRDVNVQNAETVHATHMNKILLDIAITTGFVVALNIIIYGYFSSLTIEMELLAQQQVAISIHRANALPLTASEGNQVKVLINYTMRDESLLGQRINAIMGIYDRETGSLIKISSFPNGFLINGTEGTVQLATTLTDNKTQNISAIISLTDVEKSEKYSNKVRTDLDLEAILPISLPSLEGEPHTLQQLGVATTEDQDDSISDDVAAAEEEEEEEEEEE